LRHPHLRPGHGDAEAAARLTPVSPRMEKGCPRAALFHTAPFIPPGKPLVIKYYLVLHSTIQGTYICTVSYRAVPGGRQEPTAMKVETTEAQMRKGGLEYCILSLLSAEEMYPSDVIAKLKEAK